MLDSPVGDDPMDSIPALSPGYRSMGNPIGTAEAPQNTAPDISSTSYQVSVKMTCMDSQLESVITAALAEIGVCVNVQIEPKSLTK